MNNCNLSMLRIVLGVLLSILIFPLMFITSWIMGNIWTIDNEILNKNYVIEKFNEIDGYNKLIDVAIELASDSIENTKMVEKIATEVFDKGCIDEIFEQIMDKIFEGGKIDIDLEDKLEKGICRAVVNVYNDEAENIIDAWLEGNFKDANRVIYEACADMLDEQMIELGADKLGVDKSLVNVTQVREYLDENPLSEADKELIIDACGKVIEDYVDTYAQGMAWEINASIEEAIEEFENSQELNQYSDVIIFIKKNAGIALLAAIVIFVVCWIILLMIFKVRKAGFIIPAVSLILSAIAYFAEFVFVLWMTGEITAYIAGGKDSIESFVFEFVVSFVDGVKNVILMCGTVTLVAAIVLIIAGCVLNAVRKNVYKD